MFPRPPGGHRAGDLFYQRVTVDDVEDIVNKTILNNEVIKKLQYKPANSKEVIARASDIPLR